MVSYTLIDKELKKNISLNCIPFCIEKSMPTEAIKDKLHIHDFHQLSICTAGTAKLVINDHAHEINPGSVYVISSYTPHYLKDPQELETTNILFYLDDLLHEAGSLKDHRGFQLLFVLQTSSAFNHKSSNILNLDYKGMLYVNHILKMLLDEVIDIKPGSQNLVQAYFMILIVFFTRQYETDNKINKTGERLFKIISYLDENYQQPITIAELIAIAGITERQLRHIFSEQYGCSPLQYITTLRMKHACYLLKMSDLNISEIAQNVGFDDSNYFSRKFKQEVGVSPKSYRHLCKHGQYEFEAD